MADLRVNHGPVDPDIAADLTDEEKTWLRSWNRGDEIPDVDDDVDDEDDGDDEPADYSEMSVDDLKDALRERGLPVSGNKEDLVARLEEDDDSDEE